jgi:hypothetical protein
MNYPYIQNTPQLSKRSDDTETVLTVILTKQAYKLSVLKIGEGSYKRLYTSYTDLFLTLIG